MTEIPIIKASSVANLADARYFASYGVEIMGFCFDPKSADFINPYKMSEISGWIEGPKFAGEFHNLSVEAMIETIQSQKLQYAQLKLKSITKKHAAIDMVPIILEINISHTTDFEEAENLLSQIYYADDYVQLDVRELKEEFLFEENFKNHIRHLCSKYPVILDGHFTSDNIALMIETFHPAGISLRGNSEIKTGVKSFQELDALMEALQHKL
jgi:phosphoribosylanthranilate isomerase